MSARKSGAYIYIENGLTTLDDIVSGVNDASWFEKTSTSPDEYMLHVAANRYFYIRDGGILRLGDPNDFSVHQKLIWDTSTATANSQARFYIQGGGRLELYGNVVMNMAEGTYAPYRSEIEGAVYARGNVTYKPVIQNHYSWRFSEVYSDDTFSNDIWDMENVIFGSGHAVNQYAMNFDYICKPRLHRFVDIIVDQTYGKNLATRGINFGQDWGALHKIEFKNFDLSLSPTSYKITGTQNAVVHIDGFKFGNGTDYQVVPSGNISSRSPFLSRFPQYEGLPDFGQRFSFFDNCIFENSGTNKSGLYARLGAICLVRNCQFLGTSNIGMAAQYDGTVLVWSGNIINNSTQYSASNHGSHIFVHELILTVQTENGDMVEGATVTICQKEDRERFVFKTKANGKLNQIFDLELALLGNWYRYGNGANDWEYWSDSSNNTYHTVTVFKEGYRPVIKNFIMDQPRTDTIVLKKIDARSLAF